MVNHEFCHSFITPLIEQGMYRDKINQTDSLFVPELDSIMTKQGYGTWWGFTNEHLVRLAELRIANEMGIDNLNNMRKYNIEENGFILIPDAEKLILEYENNRKDYPTFDLFLPQLIDQFRD